LQSAHRAVAEGYSLKGYFLWSLMDNFEWAWGCDRRFGILYNDFKTQQRTPKASFHWYAECIRQNRVARQQIIKPYEGFEHSQFP
jgi:beta-glucosidase